MPGWQAMVHFEVKMSHWSAYFQDDPPRRSRRSPLCLVGISNGGGSFSMAIVSLSDCKWVFNKMFLIPWSYAVLHLGARMSRFHHGFKQLSSAFERVVSVLSRCHQ